MKTNNTVVITLIACLLLQTISLAQSLENDVETYQAYLNKGSDTAVKEQWKKVVATRQQEFDRNPKDTNLRYRLVLAQYGLLSATMRDEDEDLFDEYVDKTENHLDILIKENKSWGEPRAILSGLIGLKIAYSPWKGMVLGPKSGNLIEKALKESPDSPLVNKFYGNSKLFTPEMWGGDLKLAIQSMEKSIRLYEENGHHENNWIYLDARAFLGQAYLKNNQVDKAITCYEETLAIEPAFGWIEYSLLPQARKKVATN